jgi:hypothetical protein
MELLLLDPLVALLLQTICRQYIFVVLINEFCSFTYLRPRASRRSVVHIASLLNRCSHANLSISWFIEQVVSTQMAKISTEEGIDFPTR